MSAENDRRIEQLLRSYPDDVDVGGSYDSVVVADAERVLGVQFSPSYRDFLRRYGVLGLGTNEVYGLTLADRDRGVGRSGAPSAVGFTLQRRESESLPDHLVVLVNYDGVEYACLDTGAATDDGEAPVAIWNVPSRRVLARPANTFDRYLETLLAEFEETVAEV